MQEQLICSKCKFENFCEKSAKVEVVPSEHHNLVVRVLTVGRGQNGHVVS